MANENKVSYLGDGAYVTKGSFGGQVIIYCSDGLLDYNHISLEPSAVLALIDFCQTKMGWKFVTDQNIIGGN